MTNLLFVIYENTIKFCSNRLTNIRGTSFAVQCSGLQPLVKMRYIGGKLAWSAWDRLTSVQHASLCSELEGYVKQLRSLSPPSPCQVSSIHGGPCRDHRFGSVPIGPFQDHDSFHRFLRQDADLLSFQSRYPDVVALHIDDLSLLEYIQNKLNCGHISITTSRCNYFVNDKTSLYKLFYLFLIL